MKILAFETSCDDTSIALFEDDVLLVMDTASQIKIHNETGWVVPEVAAREHANKIFDVLSNVLEVWDVDLKDIDYIAVTTDPGLLPSLLTGTTVASTISSVLEIPILPINHIQAHIFANFLERKRNDIEFPLVCLTVSGGHNEIYYLKSMWDMQRIWASQDDAAGEAFDKVAKMLWLGYPGWPIVSKLAKKYSEYLFNRGFTDEENPENNHGAWDFVPCSAPLFPRVWLVKKEYNFSFSGLKSAVKREIDKRKVLYGELRELDIWEIAYEFENAVVEVLSWKIIYAAKEKNVKTVLLAGGVSANNKLKNIINFQAKKNNLNFIHPVHNQYSMDNAAMVGILAYYKIIDKQFEHKIWVVRI